MQVSAEELSQQERGQGDAASETKEDLPLGKAEQPAAGSPCLAVQRLRRDTAGMKQELFLQNVTL